MQTNRFQIGQSILTTILIVMLMLNFGAERGVPTVSAAEPQAGLAAAVPGGPGYVMVPATAFVPETSSDTYRVDIGELSVPTISSANVVFFNAPVYLPQGATLTGLTMYYTDTISDANILGASLVRKPLPGPTLDQPVGLVVNSSQVGSGTFESDTTLDPTRAVVDNSQYSYRLWLYIYKAPDHLKLQGVRIDYSFGTALPLIQR